MTEDEFTEPESIANLITRLLLHMEKKTRIRKLIRFRWSDSPSNLHQFSLQSRRRNTNLDFEYDEESRFEPLIYLGF